MKVLVCEDNDQKWSKFCGKLAAMGVNHENIVRVRFISELARLHRTHIDLVILDIKMPSYEGAEVRVAGLELLAMLKHLDMRRAPVLAITSFPDEISEISQKFSSEGCIIYNYDEEEIWSQALEIFASQSRERGRYDFVIVTALKEERDAYIDITKGDMLSTQRNGLDIIELNVGGSLGAVVKLPRMGLVNAASITSKLLEIYSPKIIAMSGICAGIRKDISLGQLLVCDLVWEYQSGKWLEDAFVAEPYQVSMLENTRVRMEKLVENPDLIRELESSYRGKRRPSVSVDAAIVPFSTGSAVIASAERLESVKEQHRKVAGLDMEIFGVFRSAEISGIPLHRIAAKVVVDKANETKGDELHEYGCYISAAFIIRAISDLIGNPQ